MILDVTLDPIIVQIGPLQLGWGGVCTTLGMVIALWLGWRRATARGLGTTTALGGVVGWALLGGLIGARLFHILAHLSFYRAFPGATLALDDGGYALWGAWIGGIVVGIVAARSAALPIGKLLDAAAPALLLGQAIGQVGALLTGAGWGVPTNGTWGVVYWNPRDLLPPDLLGTLLYPVALYQSLGALALLAIIWVGRRWLGARDGRTFAVAAVGYTALQFGLAPVHPAATLFLGLSREQICALGVGAAVAVFNIGGERRGLPRAAIRRGVLPAVLIGLSILFWPATALANGGTIQIANQPIGPYEVSVMTSPSPVGVGNADVSVLATDPKTKQVVENLTVFIVTAPVGKAGPAQRLPATHGNATNKLFYAANVHFSEAGRYHLTVQVAGPRGSGQASFNLDVIASLLGPTLVDLIGAGIPIAGLVVWYILSERSAKKSAPEPDKAE